MRRLALILCSLALSLGLAGSASAQRTGTKAGGATRDSSEDLLRERNRSAMHPGDPLKIVGLEQGGNDIRAGTPALANSDRAVALVRTDVNYQRTLAMYADGATFNQPLPLSSPPPTRMESTTANGSSRSHASSSVPSDATASDWPWVIGLGLVALVMLWLQKRGERAPVARGLSGSRSA
jgi:hypothetical protein